MLVEALAAVREAARKEILCGGKEDRRTSFRSIRTISAFLIPIKASSCSALATGHSLAQILDATHMHAVETS